MANKASFLYFTSFLYLILLASVTSMAVQVTGTSRGLVSVFNHYGESAGGAQLWKYPARLPTTNGKSIKVYPAAMYSDRIQKYKYSVFKVQVGKRTVHVHIVDECADGDCRKNSALARRHGGMLIDIHESALRTLHIGKSLYTAKIKYIGKIPRHKMAKVLSAGGKHNYIPNKWV